MISDTEWEMWKEHDGLFTLPFIRQFVETFCKGILKQRHVGVTLYARGISVMAMKANIMIDSGSNTIDPRIAAFFVSKSGSGKGMSANFYMEIFGEKGVGLRVANVTRPTIEKLIGSTNDKIANTNKTKGYTPGHAKYQDPHIFGILEVNDDIIMDECAELFDGKEYGNTVLRILRLGLDKYGSPGNWLSSETLKNEKGDGFYCKCNVMLLTWGGDNIAKSIVQNGIFQRSMVFFNNLTVEDTAEIIKLSLSKEEKKWINDNKADIIRQMKELEAFIQSNQNKTITVDEDAKKYLTQQLDDKLTVFDIEDRAQAEYASSFLVRAKDNCLKMAAAFALGKRRMNINIQDMREACLLVITLGITSVIRELVENGVLKMETQQDIMMFKRLLGNTPRLKTDILTLIASGWGVSLPTARKRAAKYFPVDEDNVAEVVVGRKTKKTNAGSKICFKRVTDEKKTVKNQQYYKLI